MRLHAVLAAVAVTVSVAVQAGAFEPAKPECVAPAKPGGGFDLTCRIAVAALDAAGVMPRPMAVTFMPGGIGAVAYNVFNTSRAEDPNAIVALSTGSALNLAIGKYGEWTESDARFIATAGADYGAVVVRADSPIQSLGQLLDQLKADPASLVIGAGGSVGSQDWMKPALLLREVGVDPRAMRFVAFDGGGETIAALLGGSIDVYAGDVSEQRAHIEAGSMRILATLAPERLPAPFDQIPTAKELGYDVEWVVWRGYYMGKNAPDEAYQFYVDAFTKAYATPEFRKIQSDQGLFPFELAGPEFDAYVKAQVEELRGVAREAGLLTN